MLLAIAVDSTSAPATAPAIATIAGAWRLDARATAWLSMSFDIGYLTAIVVSIWAIARFGKRTYLGWSLLVYGIASLACAAAPDAGLFIAARIVQGASLGAFFTSGLLTIVATAPKRDLPVAMLLFSAVSLLAPTLAPMYAGSLLEHASWRAIFAGLAVPSFAGAYLCARYMKDVTEPRLQPFDVASFTALVFALASFQFLTTQGASVHWFAHATTFVAVAACVAAIAIYAVRELRHARAPFLDLRLLADSLPARGLAVGLLLGVLLQTTAVEAQYARSSFHLSPTGTGAFVATRCLGLLAGIVVVTMAARVPEERMMSLGLTVLAGAFVVQGLVVASGAGVELHAAIGIVQAASFALVLGPLASRLFGAIERSAFASLVVLFKLSTLFGSAIGLAIVATVFTRAASGGESLLPAYIESWYVSAALALAAAILAATLRAPAPANAPDGAAARAA